MKRILSFVLVLTLIFAFAGCGAGNAAASVKDANGDGKLTCTIAVRCDTLLDKKDKLTEGKAELVPENGAILEEREVEFKAGESVFDVFRKVLKEDKIHFEYVDSQAYNSVYIEGIGNIYEFDCGPQSGWVYMVNGVRPGVGCSAYTLADGDEILFAYTCELGEDVGAEIKDEK